MTNCFTNIFLKDWSKFTFIECSLCNIYFSESINFTKWWCILDQLIMHIQCTTCTSTKQIYLIFNYAFLQLIYWKVTLILKCNVWINQIH